jgi:hypothetical protein
MKGIKFVLGVLMIGVVYSAPAQLLFTNLTLSSNSNLVSGVANNNLNAVAYNGTSNFLAVGANQVYVCGNFNNNQTWYTGSNWSSGHVLSITNGLNLAAVTIGNNLFVATGDKNAVFSVTNVFSQISGWSSNGNIFNNTAVASGIAYNSGAFVGVSTEPVIGYTNRILSRTALWPLASWNGQDVIESFRGVTGYGTYGANGAFAACGFYGDILTSSNGGSIWQPIAGQSQEPPLYGIASDAGGQTLVTVGASSSGSGGLILIFTNRAQAFPSNGSYDTNFVALTNGFQLNAVAYTGFGFMAVGNNGEVLTLTNSGGTWKTNGVYSAAGSTINLNGVAFGTSGYMAGVGELVGNSGTVILAGTPPPTVTGAVGATNCASYPAAANNGTLSVSVVTDANHPAGTVSVDWYLGTSLVASGVTSFTPTNNPNLVGSNAPAVYTFNAVERDLRTGFTSAPTPVTLQINPRPAAVVAALNTTDCNVGDAFVLTNVLTGIGPWTVTWNDGTVQVVSGSGISTRTVFPTNTFPNTAVANAYYITNLTSADTCFGNLPGDILGTNTITINPRPTATLTPMNITDCDSGNAYTLTNTLTGIGPWTVTWNDGTVQNANTSLLTRTVIPTNSFGANLASTNVYFVTVVSNADTCEGNLPGDITGSATIIINPLPTATLVSFAVTNCNDGAPLLLTVNLTGIGPWTVTWNDGTILPSATTVLNRQVFPTNTLANTPSNNVYYVTAVSDGTACFGNQPGDIVGTNLVVVNPRPTISLLPLTSTNCNDGSLALLTANLTGIGPWTVAWNDGTVQVSNGPAPFTLTHTVFPTNMFANAASNNVYYVTTLSDVSCLASQPGDITGTNLVVVNPRPTATLTPLAISICNFGNSNVLTATLTGIGPWTNYWNDGTIQVSNGTAPYTLTRTVFPTNAFSSGQATNIYYISSVVNADSCSGNQPGDITGTNLIIVSPLSVATLAITTNDFAVTTNGVGTGLLESVSRLSTSTFDLTVGFQYLQSGTPHNIVSQTLNVTNHLAFSGAGPWTVILSDGSKTATNMFAAAGSYVWQETISTNTDTNFTFSVQSVQTTNTSCSVAPTNLYDVLVYGAPTALVYTTNTVCGSPSNTVTISAALGGFGPWTNVVWSDGFTNNLVTSSPLNRSVSTPTNSTLAQITTNFSIISLTDTYGAKTTSSNDLTGSALAIVDPFVAAAPTVPVPATYNCPNEPAVLSVVVPPNFTADWFADAGLTASLATGTTNFTAIITSAPGTNVYYVTMRYNDAFSLTNCSPDVATDVSLVSTPCLTSITVSGTNAILSWTWSGSNILQSTTNLLPPVIWQNVYTGALGPNFLTNDTTQVPIDFFRLYTPTN